MPTDPHGQSHTGNAGLFDDPDEYDETVARAERHERERLQGIIRRLERRERRQLRKEQKAAEQAMQEKSKLPWPVSWLAKAFGGGGDLSPDGEPARPVTGSIGGSGKQEKSKVRERRSSEYVIVRKPPTPEPVYGAEDIDPVDSPWLRECGMVRVKSKDPGGCHIVPKSVIQKKE